MIPEVLQLVASGACFTGAGIVYWALPEKRFRRVLKRVIRARELYQEERKPDGKKVTVYPKVTYVYKEPYGFSATIRLPAGITASDFLKHISAFEEATNSEIQYEIHQKYVHLRFYQFGLDKRMNFHEGLLEGLPDLAFPLYSRKGVETHVFDDELGAHILISGAPGTGKSVLLKLITAVLLAKNEDRVKISLINNKLVDTLPFFHIPNVEIVETIHHAEAVLEDALQLVQQRKNTLLKAKCSKISEYNQKKPDDPMYPYFIIIDEYARFSDNDDFKRLTVEVAELGRFAGVHLVIATQRADGREVISPRIKDVCLTKICFKMGTKGGSEIILGGPQAWELPLIPGRAIIYDNHFRTVQVPFISDEQCAILLDYLRRDSVGFERERQSDLGEFRPLRADES